MPEEVNVYYEGWGERWRWGTLASTTALAGRPSIVFEYSHEARAKGLELSVHTLPLEGPVVTRQRMEDQASQTLTEILGYVPGIFAPPFAVGDGLAGDLFFIRGYNATDYGYGLLKDGLRLQGNRYETSTEPYGLERTEIFRGPSSILYGENAPGGVVNLVRLKKRRAKPGSPMAATIVASCPWMSRAL